MAEAHLKIDSLQDMEQIFHHDHLSRVIDPIFPRFERTIKSYALFNLSFILIVLIELFLFIFYFNVFFQNYILGFVLSIIFFTAFSYFSLKLYLQTKKPVQLQLVIHHYLEACKKLIRYQEENADHHIALAKACCKLANSLHAREYSYYQPPKWLDILAPTCEKISCFFHFSDFHVMREKLLKTAVEEHIKLVKCEPTSLEAHAALANAYVMLSGLYLDPRKIEGFDQDRWIPTHQFNEDMDKKFRKNAERAIEEFKILSEYAPDDPWIHIQLAYSYHDLQMPENEIREYEILHRLNHEDKDVLFKLGVLYFQQGLNAKGLKVYEELKRSHYAKAESLIRHYGDYQI